ncbi:serine-type Transmembrane protease, serine 7 [Dimargaris xerosporica]|nr:serine-type Transmembrane protease, serine 7 [Dimargaris xerosporica]
MKVAVPAVLLTLGLSGAQAAPSVIDIGSHQRLIGGQDALVNQYPSTAQVHIAGKYACAASILSATWLVTAAHCLVDASHSLRSPCSLQVGAGTIANITAHRAGVASIVVHERYNANSSKNDIGLIELDAPLTFSQSIQPVAIDTQRPTLDEHLWALGWGKTAESNDEGSPILQAVELTVQGNRTCQRAYPELEPSRGDQLCTGLVPGHGPCDGDSGGPLLRVQSPTHYTLVGLTSMDASITGQVPGCGTAQTVNVFTHVAHFVPWIRNHTGILAADTLTATPSPAPTLVTTARPTMPPSTMPLAQPTTTAVPLVDSSRSFSPTVPSALLGLAPVQVVVTSWV